MRRMIGLILMLVSMLLLLAVMLALPGSGAHAYKRGEDLKVFEATCPKAQQKFYREAKNACIGRGMMLKNTYPGKCMNNLDPRNRMENIRLEGTYVCDLRL